MKGFILCWSVLFLTFVGNTQILIGEPDPAEKKEKKKKAEKAPNDSSKVQLANSGTSVYFVTNWSKTYRLLEPNGEIYGDSLGIRADETPLNIWSFGVGFQNQLNKYLMWDGGISLMRNGESYDFVGVDTAFSSQSYYNYIAMPIRLNYTIGTDFKFYAGAGFVPQMFTGFRQERQWTTSTNATDHETVKTKIGYNSFVISAIFNVGFILNFQNNWALMVSPEARIQLNSSYMKLDDYIHKGRAFGVTFGLLRNL